MPMVTWLKVTDYMHPWLQLTLGCRWRVRDQKVVCILHIPGVREVLMEQEVTDDFTMDPKQGVGNSMSCTRRNCYQQGLVVDPGVMEREYGVTKELMALFVPIECPKLAMTKHGILRPWSLDYSLSRSQANDLRELLREEFWKAVGEFSMEYASKHEGQRYAQANMIEAFCAETKTPDIFVDAMRNEWHRRLRNKKSLSPTLSK